MRVLICGSRTWDKPAVIEAMLAGLLAQFGEVVVIEGCARGADAVACRWTGGGLDGIVTHEHHPADWDRHGKAAGAVRNLQMLGDGKPDVVFAFSDSPITRGTSHMVSIAKKAGVPTYVIGRP